MMDTRGARMIKTSVVKCIHVTTVQTEGVQRSATKMVTVLYAPVHLKVTIPSNSTPTSRIVLSSTHVRGVTMVDANINVRELEKQPEVATVMKVIS
jgi:hypothetical protein